MSVVFICVADGYAFEGATPDLAYESLIKDHCGGEAPPPSKCVWYEAIKVNVSFTVNKNAPKSKEKTK